MSEKAGLTSKPKFGEWLRGIYASESNPQRDGMYVRTIRRTGRMNPGTFYELTDGNGRFWQYPAQSVERVAAPQPPAEAQPDHCTDHQRHVWGCRPCEEAAGKFNETAEQQQGGGEALEAELIALVAGPYHYHHKMDEHAEREGKAFDRCRELTIQNIRTWCATRRAMLAAQPPSAPVGVEGFVAWFNNCGVQDRPPSQLARAAWEAALAAQQGGRSDD